MHSKFLTIFTAISLALLLPAFAAFAFTWGACGHRSWHGTIWKDPEKQFATLERYGLTTYRIDVPLNNAAPHAAEDLQKLMDTVS